MRDRTGHLLTIGDTVQVHVPLSGVHVGTVVRWDGTFVRVLAPGLWGTMEGGMLPENVTVLYDDSLAMDIGL